MSVLSLGRLHVRRDVEAVDRQLRRMARGRLRNLQDAEDVVQDSWLRAAVAAEAADPPPIRNLQAYLFRIARNLIVDHRRRAAARPIVEVEEVVLLQAADPAPTPEAAVITRDELNRMNRIMAAMPAKPREVFRLARVEGLSYADIGRRLGLSRQTVHQHMARALLALQLATRADFDAET
ncbi:RNA polymerase sigma factor [Brevundimonas sp. SORGH_AS_0993]|uniref:RNA polymerase sigma factor n=1 Tax=Brevundimonas sp. SORGH_AS_0993 TaxID=3041794 RepID=UPI0027D8D42D|nr:RNA polymerase sigma factor [Brevundimonas sp. SORGH_AS_0993]